MRYHEFFAFEELGVWPRFSSDFHPDFHIAGTLVDAKGLPDIVRKSSPPPGNLNG